MIKYYTPREYQMIADRYGLGKINRISYLYLGYGGSAKVAVVTPLGKFVISKNIIASGKGIVGKSKEGLQYEIDMLKTVEGMPVPSFLRSKRKTFIEKFRGGLVTVYRFLPGKPPRKITPAMAYQLGEFFGEFHKRSHKFKKDLAARRKYYDLNPAVMEKMRPGAHRQKNAILKKAVEIVEQGVKDNYPPAEIPAGPIHVDPYSRNELFQGNKLSGIIDFGNFYLGPLMIDVGKIIMWNCCPGKKLDKRLLKKFIGGYKRKRKFSGRESAYLKKAILYAIYSHIWVDLYHVPIKYVPESYALFLVKNFLPVARQIERSGADL
ncbi:MAG: phosphotransferase [Patescibacteria group bacterium]|nr:phosphotransferase [Patescibacteria group bacterium]